MTLPPFAEFFEAAHGHPPFPWQVRLAQDVMEDGWPGLLDLPTGVGKTSALDVALWTLAAKPDRMPRRTLLVVDRRIVVDQGADHARSLLAAMMRDNAPKELRLVASRLRALQWNATEFAPPFQVATLRGGMPRDNDWARRPDVPVLGVSTVDQVGSRLLFRGYGLSARAWPMHAGLLGNDTLFLLDEVHLALPFAQTLEAIRTRYMGGDPRVPRRFVVVQMSATPGAQSQSARRFALAAADRDHPVLRRRLEAGKRARLEVVKVRATDSEAEKRHAVAARAVAAAAELQHSGAKVVAIVVNRVDTARIAWRMLAERGPTGTTECCLLTGRMRPIERDRLVREVLTPRAMAGRDRAAATPFVVVATQCIEAGADLDFDGMVNECASLDALRQRFGRVDRRGELGASNSVILGRSDEIDGDDDPVYGPALAATWAWLREGATDGRVDFGVLALRPATLPDGTPRAELLAPPSAAPVLLPAHLDALAQTSPPPAVSPDIALWLHGPDRESADIHLVWRAELDVPDATTDELQAAFAAVRPSMLEAVALPVYAARAWLQGASATIADVPMSGATETSAAGQPPRRVVVMRWQGDRVEPLDSDALDLIRPGDTLLLPTAAGGLAQGNFDPEATEAVPDVADVASLRGRGLASLRCHPRAVATWGRADAARLASTAKTTSSSLRRSRRGHPGSQHGRRRSRRPTQVRRPSGSLPAMRWQRCGDLRRSTAATSSAPRRSARARSHCPWSSTTC
ncbi:MAG: type I-U CRISPR-associated helicase/endonuclease Cas3 [Nannocystaceae bacterium]